MLSIWLISLYHRLVKRILTKQSPIKELLSLYINQIDLSYQYTPVRHVLSCSWYTDSAIFLSRFINNQSIALNIQKSSVIGYLLFIIQSITNVYYFLYHLIIYFVLFIYRFRNTV